MYLLNGPHLPTAVHYLFHCSVLRLRNLVKDGQRVQPRPKVITSGQYLAWCKWERESHMSTVAISPHGVLANNRSIAHKNLLNQIVNISAHEVAHGLMNFRYMGDARRRPFRPHGVEWQWIMRNEMGVAGKSNRFVSESVPMILCDNSFWSELVDVYYGWVGGKSWDAERMQRLIAV